tara:strand:+ start:8878 stop:10125 length:1248 start_codon:yes stop_codon:yes gene_type:complete
MSEAEQQATDTLLPEARLFVFSKDKDTLVSTSELQKDWRFARVDIKAEAGDVKAAIETFKTQPSPDLLIIQTDEINDQFTDDLGELSNYCEEGTSAIIIGPVNDVYLYRELINMGVSDYLVRPIKPNVLKEVVAKALISQLGVSDSRLIAFIGAKGGVGTSSLVQIAALTAAKTLEHKTLLMDGAGGWSSLSVGLGFDPSATLHEVARAVETDNEDALKRMLFEYSDKLMLLASGADAMLDPSIASTQYEAILDNLMVKYPVVFVDLSGADPALKKTVISRAHKTIVVTTPTVTSLRFSRSLIKEVSEVRGGDSDDVSLVVNMEGVSKANEVDQAAIAEALDIKPALSIAYMPALFLKHESEIAQMLADKEGAVMANAFLPMLRKIIAGGKEESTEKTDQNAGILGGFLSKLSSK